MEKNSISKHVSLLIIAIITMNVNIYADRIVYTYDDRGYRIRQQKEIVYNSGSTNGEAENEVEKKKEEYKENLSTAKITIYPNPTDGELIVDITGVKDFTNAQISVLDLSGNTLQKAQEIGVSNVLDLTSYKEGIYLLTIKLNDETTTWKNIKK